MMVYTVVQQWASLVYERAVGQYRCGRELRHGGAFVYADYGLVASIEPEWLQGEFNTLTGLFGRVRIRANVSKKVGMINYP